MAKLFNYHRYENFLPADFVDSLLKYCNENESKFEVARIGNKGKPEVNEDYRQCLVLGDLGELKIQFEQKVEETLPTIYDYLQIKPIEKMVFETQIAAHGNGAFFKQHIDTHTKVNSDSSRIISAVYYFYSTPKQFEGGELVLHPFDFMEGNDEMEVLPPLSNSLVVFPSFGLHEVWPVKSPNIPFKDWRFAINCWINKTH